MQELSSENANNIHFICCKTLIANDALVIENGELEIAYLKFALGLKRSLKSVEMIKQLELDKIICYDGGLVQKNVPFNLEKSILIQLMRQSESFLSKRNIINK